MLIDLNELKAILEGRIKFYSNRVPETSKINNAYYEGKIDGIKHVLKCIEEMERSQMAWRAGIVKDPDKETIEYYLDKGEKRGKEGKRGGETILEEILKKGLLGEDYFNSADWQICKIVTAMQECKRCPNYLGEDGIRCNDCKGIFLKMIEELNNDRERICR